MAAEIEYVLTSGDVQCECPSHFSVHLFQMILYSRVLLFSCVYIFFPSELWVMFWSDPLPCFISLQRIIIRSTRSAPKSLQKKKKLDQNKKTKESRAWISFLGRSLQNIITPELAREALSIQLGTRARVQKYGGERNAGRRKTKWKWHRDGNVSQKTGIIKSAQYEKGRKKKKRFVCFRFSTGLLLTHGRIVKASQVGPYSITLVDFFPFRVSGAGVSVSRSEGRWPYAPVCRNAFAHVLPHLLLLFFSFCPVIFNRKSYIRSTELKGGKIS